MVGDRQGTGHFQSDLGAASDWKVVERELPADSWEASVWFEWGTGVPSFFQCQPTASTPVHQCQPVPSLRLALQCPVSVLWAATEHLCPVPVDLSASWPTTATAYEGPLVPVARAVARVRPPKMRVAAKATVMARPAIQLPVSSRVQRAR